MVIIIDVNKSKGEAKAASNQMIHFLCGDVTKKETWEQAVALGIKNHGRIDVVVNNAGGFHSLLAPYMRCASMANIYSFA